MIFFYSFRSLGVVIYELISLKCPFDATNLCKLIESIQKADIPCLNTTEKMMSLIEK